MTTGASLTMARQSYAAWAVSTRTRSYSAARTAGRDSSVAPLTVMAGTFGSWYAARGAPAIVERVGHHLHDVRGHLPVDLVGERDEARLIAREPHLPREVIRIGRQAVAPQARPRPEGHEAEGLGGGGRDDLPHRDAELAAHDRELVDERDVDRAEGVLEQLDHLRRLRARHGDDARRDPRVERGDELT